MEKKLSMYVFCIFSDPLGSCQTLNLKKLFVKKKIATTPTAYFTGASQSTNGNGSPPSSP